MGLLTARQRSLLARILLYHTGQHFVKQNFLILIINIFSRKGIDMLSKQWYNVDTR
jgi:hypothetical protein